MSHDIREAEARLPRAEVTSYPDCGCCGSETSHNGDNLECTPCMLLFDSNTLGARYNDEAYGKSPCGTRAETPDYGTDLKTHEWVPNPCPLPQGHESECYHTASMLPIKR